MDFEKEKADWLQKPETMKTQMLTRIDGHIAKCPPKCKGICNLEMCPLGRGNTCMHRHLNDCKAKLEKTPSTEIAQKQIASIEEAKAMEDRMKAERTLLLQQEAPILEEKL